MSGTAVSLEQAPFLELTDEQLRAIVDRHGITVGADDVHRFDSMGIVHSIYALGDDLVLRVPKLHPDALADAYTGSVAAPAAVRAGVSTPRLVVFDESVDIVPVPFSIFERMHAEPLSVRLDADPLKHAADLARTRPPTRDAARQRDQRPGPARLSRPARPDSTTPNRCVAELERDGYLGNEAAPWVRDALRTSPLLGPAARHLPTVHPRRRHRHECPRPRRHVPFDHRLGRRRMGRPGDGPRLPPPSRDRRRARRLPIGDAARRRRHCRSSESSGTSFIGALQRLRLTPEPPGAPAWPTPTGRLFDLLAAAADGEAPIIEHLHRQR